MKNKFFILIITLCTLVMTVRVPAQVVTNLGIVTAGRLVFVYWPAADTNFVLQKAASANSTSWITVTSGTPLVAVCLTNTSPAEFYRLYGNTNIPPGTVEVPGGTFTMGDTLDGESDAAPISVTLSAYYMDINLVSYGQWQSVYNLAIASGYGFVDAGAGKATNYPVESVDWYDAVKWSNARSQQAGLKPVYYTDAGLTKVYTNGEVAPYVNWTANGYRLPTEAEWEMAARGGLSGERFPQGDTISCLTGGNYFGYPDFLAYDVGPAGQNSFFSTGALPFTSPVGFYPANGFGLYDMAGNVNEWCADWYGTPYAGGTNPRGPASGADRVMRGGDWEHSATSVRCANRGNNDPTFTTTTIGFRCVRGL